MLSKVKTNQISIPFLKQEAESATVQQHSDDPEQLKIIILCHDKVMVNISIKNNAFLLLIQKNLFRNNSLQKNATWHL